MLLVVLYVSCFRYTDTDAIGVLIVHIHRATGVKEMDTGGGSGEGGVECWQVAM